MNLIVLLVPLILYPVRRISTVADFYTTGSYRDGSRLLGGAELENGVTSARPESIVHPVSSNGVNQPDSSFVKGVYLNPNRAADRVYLNTILAKADSGLINTLIVDLKSDFGLIVYRSENEIAKKIKAVRPTIDLDSLVKWAADHQVKLIARLVVFKDDRLARYKNFGLKNRRGGLWRDDGGYYWVNPFSEEVWDYNIAIVKEILRKGIKSIQFDYVRFPTDGELASCRYPSTRANARTQLLVS